MAIVSYNDKTGKRNIEKSGTSKWTNHQIDGSLKVY